MLEYTFHCSVDDIRKRTDRPTTEMSERRGWESCTNGKDDIKCTTGRPQKCPDRNGAPAQTELS